MDIQKYKAEDLPGPYLRYFNSKESEILSNTPFKIEETDVYKRVPNAPITKYDDEAGYLVVKDREGETLRGFEHQEGAIDQGGRWHRQPSIKEGYGVNYQNRVSGVVKSITTRGRDGKPVESTLTDGGNNTYLNKTPDFEELSVFP